MLLSPAGFVGDAGLSLASDSEDALEETGLKAKSFDSMSRPNPIGCGLLVELGSLLKAVILVCSAELALRGR